MSDVWTPPRAEVRDIGPSGNPESSEIRQQHLSHEASIKALGLLYLFGAGFAFVAGVLFLVRFPGRQHEVIPPIAIGVLMLVLSVLYFWIGRGLRALRRSGRIAAGIMAGLGLLGFPYGTMINGYFLSLLFSKKGAMVFSDEYKQVIADTPDVKYRTSIIVWIFLALLVAVVGFVALAALRSH